MLSTQIQDQLRKKLEETKAELESSLKSLEEPVDMGDDVDSFEEETDEAEEFSTNLGKAEALKLRYAAVVDALAKFVKGTYGKCEVCGKEIESEILLIDPESRYCKADKAKKL